MEFAREFDRALEPGPRIIALESRMLAVEQRGRQHLIAIGGIFVAKLADMVGNPENLLDQDQPAAPLAFGQRVIDGDPGAVVHRHPDHLAHAPAPSSVGAELVEAPSFFRRCLKKERSEEHTSELQSLMRISYAVFCLKKKKSTKSQHPYH